jgi:hypothetical protein
VPAPSTWHLLGVLVDNDVFWVRNPCLSLVPVFGRVLALTVQECCSVAARCQWVKPAMVCQIKFTEWTRDDRLRQPVFLGIREDKDANKLVREKAS